MTAPQFKWGLADKVYTDPAEYDVQTLVAPAVALVALPTNGTALNPPKWIMGDAKGTATVTDASGNMLTGFPITGDEQHVALTAITSLSTTAHVWGAY
jgi:hypothetical protein